MRILLASLQGVLGRKEALDRTEESLIVLDRTEEFLIVQKSMNKEVVNFY